jgi:hypothetical protein
MFYKEIHLTAHILLTKMKMLIKIFLLLSKFPKCSSTDSSKSWWCILISFLHQKKNHADQQLLHTIYIYDLCEVSIVVRIVAKILILKFCKNHFFFPFVHPPCNTSKTRGETEGGREGGREGNKKDWNNNIQW